MQPENLDFTISVLGESKINSPLLMSKQTGDYLSNYVPDDEYILHDIDAKVDTQSKSFDKTKLLEKAGPREKIFFESEKVKAAIVTCGGLCPGLNNVIRAIVMCLWYRYGVREICGIRFGYRGLIPQFNLPVMPLRPEDVDSIHHNGGTMLGSSRGWGDSVGEIVDSLTHLGINMLFTIGGDGTQKGALNISKEIKKRNLEIAIVGVPKTIDNDLSFVQKSFGLETAVSKAVEAVAAAHVEATDAINGLGIVKVMGRQSGFIAAQTALACNDVNYVLVPEVPFELKGENGLLKHLENRIKYRKHAVILVAEGAGQQLLEDLGSVDASGNKKLSDIGLFLKEKISAYFKEKQIEINLKYIDPSYIIRSVPANPSDSIYCAKLGANAVHAAMAGKTELLVGLMHNCFVHIPIGMAVASKNAIDPDGELWRSVVEATGQAPLMKN